MFPYACNFVLESSVKKYPLVFKGLLTPRDIETIAILLSANSNNKFLKKVRATSEPLCTALRTRGWEGGGSFAQLRSHTSAIRHPPLNRGL